MRQCMLCAGYGFFTYGEGEDAVCLCSACSDKALELFSLAKTDKIKYINKKDEFLNAYNGDENTKKVISLAEDIKNGKTVAGAGKEIPKKGSSVVTVMETDNGKNTAGKASENDSRNKVISVAVNNTNADDSVFLPFKLLIATLFAVAAYLIPVAGLLPAVIAYIMAEEIPGGFCKYDVLRAKNLAKFAIIVNVIVILIAAVVAGVIIWDNI